jgi:hypothetical protein
MSIMITQGSNVKRPSQFYENHISNFNLHSDINMKCYDHESKVEFNKLLHKIAAFKNFEIIL